MKSFLPLLGFCVSVVWSDSDKDFGRFDCYPEPSANEAACVERGCIWDSAAESSIPSCYYPSTWGYTQIGSVIENVTEESYQLSSNNNFKFPYPGGIENVILEVIHISEACLRLRYRDMNNPNRYEVPISVPPPIQPDESPTERLYTFSTSPSIDDLFSFDIIRTREANMILSSKNMPGFTYSDQFLQIMLSFSNETHLYGWGERYSQVKIPTDKYTTLISWSRDIVDIPGYGNSYGVHPFLLGIGRNGDAFGVFILNSNAMELVVTPYPALQYRTIGGIIDLFVFMGPSVKEVIQQYWDIIGYPMLPPFWSLGFHLSRWGYNTLNKTRETVMGMIDAGVPYDTQWNDIDYMDNKKDFTYDPVMFEGLPEFVDILHNNYDMHYVMIVDPAISNESNYEPYQNGLDNNVFMRNDQNGVLLGEVWPGVCAFPDFFKDSTQQWWTHEISSWYQVVNFDGLWIDMNEPSNFVNGQLGGCSNNPYDKPPYFPSALSANSDSLATKTACMSAQQGDMDKSTVHYNVHSLYGHSEAIATYKSLRQTQPQKRPFILSRSTYPGSGQYTGHWLGDNNANYTDMQISMSGIIAFNMYGIPLVGADICGFFGNTTLELCTRWMEIGSFYPFSRNHNGYGYIPQDPASLGGSVASASQKYLKLRYQLLPYLYTLFYRSYTFAEMVVNAIWLVDDWLPSCVEDEYCMSIESQFLWGDALMISPALSAYQTQVIAFFPAMNDRLNIEERWFELTSGEELPIFGDKEKSLQTINCPLEYLPLHLRGGHILPMHTTDLGVQTTTLLRKNSFQILVALDSQLNASGEVFIDDGESADSIEELQYVNTWFTLSCETEDVEEYSCMFETHTDGNYEPLNKNIDLIVMYGFGNKYFMPNVNWSNSELEIEFIEKNYTDIIVSYDTSRGVLTFDMSGMTVPINKDAQIVWYMSLYKINNGGGGDGNGDGGDGGGEDEESGSSSGETAGIVIGVILGVLLAFGAAYFLFKRKERHHHSRAHGDYVPVDELHPL